MRIFVDMDGTLATIYKETGDRFRTPGYFLGLAPYKSMLRATKTMIASGLDVYVITTVYTLEAMREKEAWLRKYLPELPVSKRIYVLHGKNKTDCVPGGVQGDDVLIDDHTPNLLEWPGIGIKAINPINHVRGVWKSETVNVNSADSLFSMLCVQRIG